jgi:hypothetical protein
LQDSQHSAAELSNSKPQQTERCTVLCLCSTGSARSSSTAAANSNSQKDGQHAAAAEGSQAAF